MSCSLFGRHGDPAIALRKEVHQLRSALRDIVDELDDGLDADGPGHSHEVSGVWDRDNGAKAGTKCEWCAKWNQIRIMIS